MAKRRRRRLSDAEVDLLQGKLGQKEAIRRLVRYLRPLTPWIIAGLILTFLGSIANLGVPFIAKHFFDTIEHNKGRGDYTLLHLQTGLAVGLMLVKSILLFAQAYTWALVSNRLTLRLRNEVFVHLQNQSIAFFDHRKTGQLLSSMSNDVPQLTAVLDVIQEMAGSPFLLVGGLVYMFFLNWQLTLISLTCLPFMLFLILWASRRIQHYSQLLQSNRARSMDLAEETLSAIRIVKSFGNEGYEIDRYRKQSEDVYHNVMSTVRVKNMARPLVEFIGGVAIVTVLWIGGQQIISPMSVITVGSLFAFVLALQQVADSARNVGNISMNMTQAGVAADRVFTLLDMASDIQEKPNACALPDGAGRVVFDQVSFRYGGGAPVLSDVSFTMEPGEVVALVGPTGAGKTTIAALIQRFYDVTGGAITVDGVDLRECTLASLRGKIGVVPQESTLFAGSLRDNIRYGRLDATEEEVIAAAQTANAWEFIDRLKGGLDAVVGERGVRLSGGQRQRIAIARAVLRDPAILILDEATSSLDTHSEALVQDALQKLVRDRTTLVIAHRLSTVRNADKILVLKDGLVAECGRHEDLLRQNGIYARLYHTQFERHGELEPA